MDVKPPGGKRSFGQYLAELTPEQRKEWFKKRAEKQRAAKLALVALKLDAHEDILNELKDKIVADFKRESIFPGPNWEPSTDILENLWRAIDKGVDIDEIKHYLNQIGYSSKLWFKIKKRLFDEVISQPEDVGLRMIGGMKFAIDTIKRETLYMKKMQRNKPYQFSKEIIMGAEIVAQLEMKLAKSLADMGLVASKKQGGGGINVIVNTPRPDGKNEVTIEAVKGEERQSLTIDGDNGQLQPQRVAD